MVYPLARGREVLRLFDDFSRNCPDEVSTQALLFTTRPEIRRSRSPFVIAGLRVEARRLCSR